MNPKIITWELNKEAKMTIEDALLSPKSMELVSGIATSVASTSISMRQNHDWDTTTSGSEFDKGDTFPLTCSSAGVITLAFAPSTAVANIYVYLANDDCGTRVDMTGATLSTNVLTLGTSGIATAASQKVIVYYEYASPATSQTWTITADKFAGSYLMVGQTVLRNAETGKDERFQVKCPNVKFPSNLNLDFSAEGDPQPTSFEIEIMRASDSSNMIQMTKI